MIDEGSTSYIYSVDNKTIKKVLKRKTKGLSAHEQFKIQLTAYTITHNFKTLFVPKPISWDTHSYTMQKIDVSEPIGTCSELEDFIEQMKQHGYVAFDYEMYLQPDGRIALIDFGRFVPAPN